jgi:hypothetical protein
LIASEEYLPNIKKIGIFKPSFLNTDSRTPGNAKPLRYRISSSHPHRIDDETADVNDVKWRRIRTGRKGTGSEEIVKEKFVAES